MKDEWRWEGRHGSYELVKTPLNIGRLYKSSQTQGNGMTQRGWAVARNKNPKEPRWWDPDSFEYIAFLGPMKLKDAKDTAKTLLLAGQL